MEPCDQCRCIEEIVCAAVLWFLLERGGEAEQATADREHPIGNIRLAIAHGKNQSPCRTSLLGVSEATVANDETDELTQLFRCLTGEIHGAGIVMGNSFESRQTKVTR